MGLIERAWMCVSRLRARGGSALYGGLLRLTGQSTVEYALVGALVIIAAAATLSAVGTEIGTVFGRIASDLAKGASTP